jgi:hypothetical protein
VEALKQGVERAKEVRIADKVKLQP